MRKGSGKLLAFSHIIEKLRLHRIHGTRSGFVFPASVFGQRGALQIASDPVYGAFEYAIRCCKTARCPYCDKNNAEHHKREKWDGFGRDDWISRSDPRGKIDPAPVAELQGRRQAGTQICCCREIVDLLFDIADITAVSGLHNGSVGSKRKFVPAYASIDNAKACETCDENIFKFCKVFFARQNSWNVRLGGNGDALARTSEAGSKTVPVAG